LIYLDRSAAQRDASPYHITIRSEFAHNAFPQRAAFGFAGAPAPYIYTRFLGNLGKTSDCAIMTRNHPQPSANHPQPFLKKKFDTFCGRGHPLQ